MVGHITLDKNHTLTSFTCVVHNLISEEDENICQECGGAYDDDDEEAQRAWIVCDGPQCWKWYHYWCAGFESKPRSSVPFLCPTSSS